MDSPEAARILGVAESEIVDVRQHAGWWEARHHDMATHDETWRPVLAVPDDAPVEQSEPERTAPATRARKVRR